jgi:hypothetical protein
MTKREVSTCCRVGSVDGGRQPPLRLESRGAATAAATSATLQRFLEHWLLATRNQGITRNSRPARRYSWRPGSPLRRASGAATDNAVAERRQPDLFREANPYKMLAGRLRPPPVLNSGSDQTCRGRSCPRRYSAPAPR